MDYNKNWYKNEEKAKLAEYIIGLERKALDRWFQGDSSGYRELWSERNFTYFDSVMDHRVDTHEEISAFVKQAVDGNLHADSYDFVSPRVQIGGNMAVLTFQLHAATNLIHIHYNYIEIYQKEGDQWRVIHSTWSFIQPLTNDFGAVKEIV